MNEIKLNPCPFCGSASMINTSLYGTHYINCYRVDCGFVGPNNDPKGEKWNSIYIKSKTDSPYMDPFKLKKLKKKDLLEKALNLYNENIELNKKFDEFDLKYNKALSEKHDLNKELEQLKDDKLHVHKKVAAKNEIISSKYEEINCLETANKKLIRSRERIQENYEKLDKEYKLLVLQYALLLEHTWRKGL